MHAQLCQQLIELNRAFYATYAESFSNSRYQLQPGVHTLLPDLLRQASLLDLGCGNGNLALALRHRAFSGHYTGLDNDAQLLAIAQQKLTPPEEANSATYCFKKADLSLPDWGAELLPESFPCISSFATLHHLPPNLLPAFISQTQALLQGNGLFILSTWQPLSSPRLRERIIPWEVIGVKPSELSPYDLLLDWRSASQSAAKYRYVHQYEAPELIRALEDQEFTLIRQFLSDGKENNQLGLYQLWQKN